MKQRSITLLLLAVMTVSVVSAAGVVTAAPKGLATPKLMAPHNRAIVPASLSQGVTFQWTAVRGASYYLLEFQKGTVSAQNSIVWTPYAHYPPPTATATTNFAGAGAYRWRVTAKSMTPALDSAPSNWRYFTAT